MDNLAGFRGRLNGSRAKKSLRPWVLKGLGQPASLHPDNLVSPKEEAIEAPVADAAMGEPRGETLGRLASVVSAAGGGDCCEALNAAAAEIILRWSNQQSVRSLPSCQGKTVTDDSNSRDNQKSDVESPLAEPEETHPTYEGLKNLKPCPTFKITFKDVSCRLSTPQVALQRTDDFAGGIARHMDENLENCTWQRLAPWIRAKCRSELPSGVARTP